MRRVLHAPSPLLPTRLCPLFPLCAPLFVPSSPHCVLFLLCALVPPCLCPRRPIVCYSYCEPLLMAPWPPTWLCPAFSTSTGRIMRQSNSDILRGQGAGGGRCVQQQPGGCCTSPVVGAAEAMGRPCGAKGTRHRQQHVCAAIKVQCSGTCSRSFVAQHPLPAQGCGRAAGQGATLAWPPWKVDTATITTGRSDRSRPCQRGQPRAVLTPPHTGARASTVIGRRTAPTSAPWTRSRS